MNSFTVALDHSSVAPGIVAESSLYLFSILCHSPVKMSTKQIKAEKRSLSETEVISCVRHRHRFVMCALCNALHFEYVIYDYSLWELIQMVVVIKWHS